MVGTLFLLMFDDYDDDDDDYEILRNHKTKSKNHFYFFRTSQA